MTDPNARTSWPFLTSISLLAAANLLVHWGYVVDDAYISFRYAHNVIAGNGLVFNVGERVEGFSNPLWVGLLSLGGLAGVKLPTVAKLLGIGFYILLLRSVYQLGMHFGDRSFARSLSMLIAVAPQMGFWANAGLETVSVAYFLAAGATHAISDSKRGRVSNSLVSYACLIVISRPEGVALAGILIGYASLRHLKVVPNQWRLLVFLLFVTVVCLLRFWYFGELAPNTYFVKSGSPLTNALSGCSYVLVALISAGGVAIPLAIVVERRADRPGKLLLGLLLAFFLAFQLRFGWDWMPHARMAVPYLVFALIPYVHVVTRFGQRNPWQGVLVMALWLVAWGGHAMKEGHIPSSLHLPEENRHPYHELGHFLSDQFSEEDLFVYDEMGVLPFFGNVRFLDTNGLTDKAIAQSKYGQPDVEEHLDFVFNRIRHSRPRGIILYAADAPGSEHFLSRQPRPWAARLTASPWFADTFKHRVSFDDIHLFVTRAAKQ